MKKVLTTVLVIVSIFSFANAYNPPAGAENLLDYSNPESLSGRKTVTGGALFSSGADSVAVNPALSAGEQRVNLNLGYTFLHSANEENKHKIGSAFQTAILIPSKMFVFSGLLNGTFVPFNELSLGNSFTLNLGLSKEITEKLDIGLSLNTGVAWNEGVTWALGGNIGFNYLLGNLGFIKDFRFGASVLNLGKNYTLTNNPGINSEKESSQFPTIATVKAGVSGTLLKTDAMNIGIALDFTTALFQNLVIDFNTQFLIKDMIYISIGEKFNVAEAINKKWNSIPSIGIGFRFNLDVKNNQYLDKKGWNESEMTVSAAYKNMYSTVNAASVGVDLDLGMEDKAAPVIIFLDEEE